MGRFTAEGKGGETKKKEGKEEMKIKKTREGNHYPDNIKKCYNITRKWW